MMNATHEKLGFDEVRLVAYGQWEGIHRALGIHLTTTDPRKHTPCPACGGKDRFRVKPSYAEYGNWFCSGGGDSQSGDGFTLLCHQYGYSLGDALKAVKEVLRLDTRLTSTERARLSAKAAEQAERYAQQVRFKEEQRRLFFDIRDAMDKMRLSMDCLEDELQSHEFKQRQLNEVIPFVEMPLIDAVLRANQHVSACNADLYKLAKQLQQGAL